MLLVPCSSAYMTLDLSNLELANIEIAYHFFQYNNVWVISFFIENLPHVCVYTQMHHHQELECRVRC